MKHIFFSNLFVSLLWMAAIGVCPSEAAAEPQTSSNDAAQTPVAAVQKGGIVIVPSLEKPKNARKFEEKDFAGYLLVYFKDQIQSAYMAVSRDGHTFTDLNNGRPIFDGALLAEQKKCARPSHYAGTRWRVIPRHDRPAHLRSACGLSHHAVAAAPGAVRLGQQCATIPREGHNGSVRIEVTVALEDEAGTPSRLIRRLPISTKSKSPLMASPTILSWIKPATT